MSNQPETDGAVTERRPNWATRILFIVLALAVAAMVVYGIVQLNTGGDADADATDSTGDSSVEPTAPEPTDDEDGDGDGNATDGPSGETTVLDKPLGGQEAIDALGDDIQIVADRNNMTVEEVEELLLSDSTMKVSPTGHIFASGGSAP